MPVTHRKLASSFAVIAAHRAFPEGQIAGDKISGIDTLVFLMGMENLATLVNELIHSGRPPDTPIALIRWGTTPRQQTVVGTLTDIVLKAEEQKFSPPTVAIVGEVVKLRQKLCWFDNKPLFGKRVVVTRAKRQNNHLKELLFRHGAEPVEFTTIKIETTGLARLNDALSRLGEFDWIIFTSTNGVDIFFSQLQHQELDARRLAGIKVCALGKATAQALSGYGIEADLIPQDWSSSGILNSFTKLSIEGAHLLLPQAEEASLSLCHGLAKMGAKVERVAIYRTTIPQEDTKEVKKQITTGKVDVITFTSPSTVRGLITLMEGDVAVLNQATIACIGPVTKAEAEDKGLRVDVVAKEHSVNGLVEALVDKFGEN
jgi:uroporphyrinogen III methyltransferase/synthase